VFAALLPVLLLLLQRKECSHGENCLLARNALEYWLHPDK
jgi:hypothetical protein